MRVVYHDEARIEGFEAAEWYAAQQESLGIRFMAQWKEAEQRLQSNHEICRCFEGELRKCRLGIFPYSLVFRIRNGEIQIIAVMHMSREPGYWRDRRGMG